MAPFRRVLIFALAVFLGASLAPLPTAAYQVFLRKAKKYGAKDCLFCHTQEDGGDAWNERGRWLIDEKGRRKADQIDVDWLADYKPDERGRDAEKEREKPPSF